MKSCQDTLMSRQLGAGIPALNTDTIRGLHIPIPCAGNPPKSLEIQRKIVEYLDNFAELTAELTAREKQYEYYRNTLLGFYKIGGGNLTIVWKPLGEVAALKRGRVISKVSLEENTGIYPVYSSQTSNNGKIGELSTFDFNQEAITWTTDGANAGTVFYRNGMFSITNVCGLITITNTKQLCYKYLYYYLSIEAPKHVYPGMGNPKLMSHQISKIMIPIPPLQEQQRIVDILDRFDTLTHSLTEGLPREIELRQKQYEYYRDQLLSFS